MPRDRFTFIHLSTQITTDYVPEVCSDVQPTNAELLVVTLASPLPTDYLIVHFPNGLLGWAHMFSGSLVFRPPERNALL